MRPAIRFAAVSSALLGLGACAHAAAPLPSLDIADSPQLLGNVPHGYFDPLLRLASFHRQGPRRLSSRSPIVALCADAQAKAVLDRDLPGLTTRPEFDMFKHMSLRTLQSMSHGRMTHADVAKVDADLAKLPAESSGESLQRVAMRQ